MSKSNCGKQPEAPELEKLRKLKEFSQKCGEFLDFLLHTKDYRLAKWRKEAGIDKLYPVHVSHEALLAEFFEIDLDKTEQERKAILDYLRDCVNG